MLIYTEGQIGQVQHKLTSTSPCFRYRENKRSQALLKKVQWPDITLAVKGKCSVQAFVFRLLSSIHTQEFWFFGYVTTRYVFSHHSVQFY